MGDQNERERTRTGGQRRGDVQLKVFFISNNDLSFVDSTETWNNKKTARCHKTEAQGAGLLVCFLSHVLYLPVTVAPPLSHVTGLLYF